MKLLFLLFVLCLGFVTGVNAEEAAAEAIPMVDGMAKFLTDFLANYSWGSTVILVLSILGSLVALVSAVVLITPSQKDDDVLAKIKSNEWGKAVLYFFSKFSFFNPKK